MPGECVFLPLTRGMIACVFRLQPVGIVTGYDAVQSGNETALQEAVYAQPVAAGIDAGLPAFEVYTSGRCAVQADMTCIL